MKSNVKRWLAGGMAFTLAFGCAVPVYAEESEKHPIAQEEAALSDDLEGAEIIGEEVQEETETELSSDEEIEEPGTEEAVAVDTGEDINEDDIVQIPDLALKSLLLEYDADSDGELSKTEMEAITSIWYDGYGEDETISDLTGLEYAINVTEFKISNSGVTDISVMKNMENLKFIDLDGNQISDILPLANHTMLAEVNINRNKISDLSPLASVPSLEFLRAYSNQISDISTLKSNTALICLELSNNQISDISVLENNKELIRLGLSNNQISNISVLKEMTELRELLLDNNQISDISVFNELGEVPYETIELSGNAITDITPLKAVKDNTPYLYLYDMDAITKEVVFDTFIPDGTSKSVLVGNKLEVRNEFEWISTVDIGARDGWDETVEDFVEDNISDEDIIIQSSNENVVKVEDQRYAVGMMPGTTTVTASVGNVTKNYSVRVAEKEEPVSTEAEKLDTLTSHGNGICSVLDDEETLWNIDSDKAERVQGNVANYIGRAVYGKKIKDVKMRYYVLDQNETLWRCDKEEGGTEYSTEVIFSNVDSFDDCYVLTKDGILSDIETKETLFTDVVSFDGYCAFTTDGAMYLIESGKKLGENIRDYQIKWNGEIYIDDIVLTQDNKVYDLGTSETYAEDVSELYYINNNEELYFYLKNGELHVLARVAGEVQELNAIENVKKMYENADLFTLNDGSTWTWNIATNYEDKMELDFTKISDALPVDKFTDRDGLLDEQGNYWDIYSDWEYDEDSEMIYINRIFTCVASDVREWGCAYYDYYINNNNELYYYMKDDETEQIVWKQVRNNVLTLEYPYYISADYVLYEIIESDIDNVQEILTDVAEFKPAGYNANMVYIIRKDGSIWKYDGINSDNGVPYMVKEATAEEPYENPFTDVSEGQWYEEAVEYVNSNNIMMGLTDETFGPDVTLDRSQFATILYRVSGAPDVTYQKKFADVADGQWYTSAIIWASENGIVSGYANGNFGVTDSITREQMAVMMYRYAQYKGYDTSNMAEFDQFTDAANVSSYAVEAMRWAVGSGLISGKAGNILDPQGSATRAECASIIMRFMEKY